MRRRIQFSVEADEYLALQRKAASKGLTVGDFAKTATFDHINQHPPKGIMLEIWESRRPERPTDAPRGDPAEVTHAE